MALDVDISEIQDGTWEVKGGVYSREDLLYRTVVSVPESQILGYRIVTCPSRPESYAFVEYILDNVYAMDPCTKYLPRHHDDIDDRLLRVALRLCL